MHNIERVGKHNKSMSIGTATSSYQKPKARCIASNSVMLPAAARYLLVSLSLLPITNDKSTPKHKSRLSVMIHGMISAAMKDEVSALVAAVEAGNVVGETASAAVVAKAVDTATSTVAVAADVEAAAAVSGAVVATDEAPRKSLMKNSLFISIPLPPAGEVNQDNLVAEYLLELQQIYQIIIAQFDTRNAISALIMSYTFLIQKPAKPSAEIKPEPPIVILSAEEQAVADEKDARDFADIGEFSPRPLPLNLDTEQSLREAVEEMTSTPVNAKVASAGAIVQVPQSPVAAMMKQGAFAVPMTCTVLNLQNQVPTCSQLTPF